MDLCFPNAQSCICKVTLILVIANGVLTDRRLSSRKKARFDHCKKLKFAERIYMDNEEVRVPVGSDFKLNCNVIGRPEPNMTWTKDETPLKEISYRSFGERSLEKVFAINLRNLLVADSGRYKCTADNGQCKTISNTLRLVVSENTPVKIPQIKELFPHVSDIIVGETITFSCTVVQHKDFTPFIKWVRYRSYNQSSAADHIKNPNKSNGSYTKAGKGAASLPSEVDIERISSTKRYESGGLVYETTDLKLEASHHSKFTIHSASAEDSGEYACLAFNQVGFDLRRAKLVVSQPPSATREQLERMYMSKYNSSIKLPMSLATVVVIPVCLVVMLIIGCVWWHSNQQKLEEERRELEKQKLVEMNRVEERAREQMNRNVMTSLPSTSSDSGNGPPKYSEHHGMMINNRTTNYMNINNRNQNNNKNKSGVSINKNNNKSENSARINNSKNNENTNNNNNNNNNDNKNNNNNNNNNMSDNYTSKSKSNMNNEDERDERSHNNIIHNNNINNNPDINYNNDHPDDENLNEIGETTNLVQ